MAATIKDVAREAGVSISTVSRVINNSKPVSPEVKEKVNRVIESLQYKPNEIARTLVTKKSHLVGVIITDIGNSYITEMVRGIEEIGKMYGYDILLCSTYEDLEAEIKYVKLLNQKQVEGIILISKNLDVSIKQLIDEYKIPFIFLSRYTYQNDYPTVTINNFDAAYEMTRYLVGLGHNRIALVSNLSEGNSTNLQKLEGYKKAMTEMEYDYMKVHYTQGLTYKHGYYIGKEVLSDEFKPTAVFCVNDELAVGLMNYFQDNNIKVPEEISVCGFGDIKITNYLRPSLTTINEPYYDIGAVAIRRIIKELSNEKIDDIHIKLPFKVQPRNSTKKIKL